MFIKLLAIFTIIPLIELFVLIKIGGMIGTLNTLLLILMTGAAGAYLARTQGFETLSRIRSEMSRGRLPAGELLDGAMILAGGVVLLTPGFCTDLMGFFLLVPFTRQYIKQIARLWIQREIEKGRIDIHRR